MDEEGFGPRVTTPRAATVARQLARDDIAALWRAPGDATLDLVRASRGRIELHRIHADGADELVDATSIRISAFFKRAASIRDFVRSRFGTDTGWVPVPRGGALKEANGEQQIAAAALADAADKQAIARVLPQGVMEVAVPGSGGTEVYTVGRRGQSELARVVPRQHSGVMPVVSLLLAAASIGVGIWILIRTSTDLIGLPFFIAGVALLLFALGTKYSPSEAIAPGERAQWEELRTDKRSDGGGNGD